MIETGEECENSHEKFGKACSEGRRRCIYTTDAVPDAEYVQDCKGSPKKMTRTLRMPLQTRFWRAGRKSDSCAGRNFSALG